MSDSFVTPWTVACQSSVHGISQARILEWVAFSFSRGSSRPRDRTFVSCVPELQVDSLHTESSGIGPTPFTLSHLFNPFEAVSVTDASLQMR